jgi:hypothetical protein
MMRQKAAPRNMSGKALSIAPITSVHVLQQPLYRSHGAQQESWLPLSWALEQLNSSSCPVPVRRQTRL